MDKEIVIEDYAKKTKLVLDEETGSLTIDDLLKNLPKSAEENSSLAQETLDSLGNGDDPSDLESLIFAMATDQIVASSEEMTLNKKAWFILETMAFYDPKMFGEYIHYLDWLGIGGKKLVDFYESKRVGGNIRTMVNEFRTNIDKIKKYKQLSNICKRMSTLKPEQIFTVAKDALAEWCNDSSVKRYHEKQMLMMGCLVDKGTEQQKKWIDTIKKHIEGNQLSDSYVASMLNYCVYLFNAANTLVKQVDDTKSESDTNSKELAQKLSGIDPYEPFVAPCIFALFVMPAHEIKRLWKVFKKEIDK